LKFYFNLIYCLIFNEDFIFFLLFYINPFSLAIQNANKNGGEKIPDK
jgi:hypothetical protein